MSAESPATPVASLAYHLAADALESVKLAPTSAVLWQRLSTFVQVLVGGERSILTDGIAALPSETVAVQWLRCSALAYLTRDPRWLIRQAALVDDATAPDAVMALLGLAWHHALVRTAAGSGFMQLLGDMAAPRLQRLLAARLPDLARRDLDTPRRTVTEGRLRVAIYTPQVVGSGHGGTTFTLNAMSVLACLDVEFRTFTAQEATIPALLSYMGGDEVLAQLPMARESLKMNVPGEAQIVLPNGEFSLRLRLEQMARAIDDYAPDLVMFVGLMSPVAFRLYDHYPMVGLSIHAVPPAVPVDVWLSAQPPGDLPQWPDLPTPHPAHFPFRFWPVGNVTPVDRRVAGVPASAIVLVTVGYRLDTEIVPPWSGQMAAFVAAHAQVHWLLIGVAAGKAPELPANSRIHMVPAQSNVASWLAACDVYVNPPRVGGGGSVAEAMEQGLPVASFAGSDGGDKVGAWAAACDDDYFKQLAAWVTDPAARRQAGDAMREQFRTRLDLSGEAAAAGLMQACRLAIELFDRRMAAEHA